MRNKNFYIVSVFMFAILFLTIIFLGNINNNGGDIIDKKIDKIEKIYQGPVPEGYDEEHFRLTGKTIILNQK